MTLRLRAAASSISAVGLMAFVRQVTSPGGAAGQAAQPERQSRVSDTGFLAGTVIS